MEKHIHSLAEFDAEAAVFAHRIQPQSGQATLVTLSGELGAGKTAFVKAFARALGIIEDVTSPTFVLMKLYAVPLDFVRGENAKAFSRLIHIDAYRLKNGEELATLRFDEYAQDAGNLLMLEWPERVANVLPAPAVSIAIEVLSGDERKITYG